MLPIKTIKLDRYFDETRFGYLFLEGMFKYLKLNKEEIFNKLNISGSTYRTNKQRPKIKSKVMLHDLLNYINHNDLIIANKILYEEYMELLIYNIIYKNEIDFSKELDVIEGYINEDNYLKPVFVLLKIYLKIGFSKKSKEFIVKDTKEDFDYINYFSNFFIDQCQTIYCLITTFLTGKIKSISKQLEDFQEGQIFHSTYCNMLSGIYFLNNEFGLSNAYAQQANQAFMRELNLNGLIASSINLCASYNKIKEYRKTITLAFKIINTLFHQEKYKERLHFALIHLLVALLNMDMKEEALSIVKKYIGQEELKNPGIAILCILLFALDESNWEEKIGEYPHDFKVHSITKDYICFLKSGQKTKDLDMILKTHIGEEFENIFMKIKK